MSEVPTTPEQQTRGLHLLLQNTLASKLEKSYKTVHLEGDSNLDKNKRIALLLYNHQTETDTAAMARIANTTNRKLINLVRPSGTLLRNIAQIANPLSHIIYTDQSVTDPEERNRKNKESFQNLAVKLALMPSSAISLAPDGGRSPNKLEPQVVSTRGIQMLESSLAKMGIANHLAIYPVGLNFSGDVANIHIGADLAADVNGFTTKINSLGNNVDEIKAVNQEFRGYIANAVNALLPE